MERLNVSKRVPRRLLMSADREGMEAAITRELAAQLAKEIVKRAKVEGREYQYEDMLEFRMEVGVEFERPKQQMMHVVHDEYMSMDMADAMQYFMTRPMPNFMPQIVLADPEDAEGFDADSTDPVDIEFKET